MKLQKSLFSWFSKELAHPEAFFSFLQQHGITAIYQHVTPNDMQETIARFIKRGRQANVKVFLLAGEANWTLEPKDLHRHIEQATKWDGIVVDVEPYLLKGFNKEIMAAYVSAMRNAYQKAHSLGVSFILCIPYFYDSLGYTTELEVLIRDCCDGISVMNYYRGKEIPHLETEAKLCRLYQKTLETIYELQPPGKHGLKDINTYYHLGLKKVDENFQTLAKHYQNQEVKISYHEFVYFQELTE
ncbi:hypothetical protein [Jeotgalibaca porci]|uniref:hypothetical protein n=2 Tax=Jeotgalibaca porci TaxID=1868793 RepID=UPI0035A1130E